MSEDVKLLPCPFCGSERVTVWNIRDGQQAICKDCKSTGAPVFLGREGVQGAHRDAIVAWNRRAPAPACSEWRPPEDRGGRMTDRPIIFSAPMVRALLDGRKSQTRRMLKPQPEVFLLADKTPAPVDLIHIEGEPLPCVAVGRVLTRHSASYAVGDRLLPAMTIPSLGSRYCADVFGAIWSRAVDGETWRRLKGTPQSRGYLTVTPACDGKYRTRAIHKLVAETYYGHPLDKRDQVRHLNGDKTDNAPENLDWGSQSDNWTDRCAHGRGSGTSHHAARLTPEIVAEIRRSSTPQRELARCLGVSQSTIWEARNAHTWRVSPTPKAPNFPRWASRLTLTVTDVRVQRLQDISEADAVAEGIRTMRDEHGDLINGVYVGREGPGRWVTPWPTAREAFADLWNSIHGPDAWAENPWVVAISFSTDRHNIDQPARAAA